MPRPLQTTPAPEPYFPPIPGGGGGHPPFPHPGHRDDPWAGGKLETLIIGVVLGMVAIIVIVFVVMMTCRHYEVGLFRRRVLGSRRALRAAEAEAAQQQFHNSNGARAYLPPDVVLQRMHSLNAARAAGGLGHHGPALPGMEGEEMRHLHGPAANVVPMPTAYQQHAAVGIVLEAHHQHHRPHAATRQVHVRPVRPRRRWWEFWRLDDDDDDDSYDSVVAPHPVPHSPAVPRQPIPSARPIAFQREGDRGGPMPSQAVGRQGPHQYKKAAHRPVPSPSPSTPYGPGPACEYVDTYGDATGNYYTTTAASVVAGDVPMTQQQHYLGANPPSTSSTKGAAPLWGNSFDPFGPYPHSGGGSAAVAVPSSPPPPQPPAGGAHHLPSGGLGSGGWSSNIASFLQGSGRVGTALGEGHPDSLPTSTGSSSRRGGGAVNNSTNRRGCDGDGDDEADFYIGSGAHQHNADSVSKRAGGPHQQQQAHHHVQGAATTPDSSSGGSWDEPQQPVGGGSHRPHGEQHASFTRQQEQLQHAAAAAAHHHHHHSSRHHTRGGDDDEDDDEVRSVGSDEADVYHKGNVLLPSYLFAGSRGGAVGGGAAAGVGHNNNAAAPSSGGNVHTNRGAGGSDDDGGSNGSSAVSRYGPLEGEGCGAGAPISSVNNRGGGGHHRDHHDGVNSSGEYHQGGGNGTIPLSSDSALAPAMLPVGVVVGRYANSNSMANTATGQQQSASPASALGAGGGIGGHSHGVSIGSGSGPSTNSVNRISLWADEQIMRGRIVQ